MSKKDKMLDEVMMMMAESEDGKELPDTLEEAPEVVFVDANELGAGGLEELMMKIYERVQENPVKGARAHEDRHGAVLDLTGISDEDFEALLEGAVMGMDYEEDYDEEAGPKVKRPWLLS